MHNVKCHHTNCQLKGQYNHPGTPGRLLCENHLQAYFDALKEEAKTQQQHPVPANPLEVIIYNRELSFSEKIDQLQKLTEIEV